MNFAFEKPTIRIYKYYFFGISKPVIIQAYNKQEARLTMDRVWGQLGKEYQASKIIGETVSVPVFGVTKREENGKSYVWVSKAYSKSGWMELDDFEKKFK